MGGATRRHARLHGCVPHVEGRPRGGTGSIPRGQRQAHELRSRRDHFDGRRRPKSSGSFCRNDITHRVAVLSVPYCNRRRLGSAASSANQQGAGAFADVPAIPGLGPFARRASRPTNQLVAELPRIFHATSHGLTKSDYSISNPTALGSCSPSALSVKAQYLDQFSRRATRPFQRQPCEITSSAVRATIWSSTSPEPRLVSRRASTKTKHGCHQSNSIRCRAYHRLQSAAIIEQPFRAHRPTEMTVSMPMARTAEETNQPGRWRPTVSEIRGLPLRAAGIRRGIAELAKTFERSSGG